MIIRPLTIQETEYIFHNHMQQDFAPDEIRPLASIKELMAAGRYHTYGLYEQEELRAYVYFLEENGTLLCDYFAVCAGGRGKGYGSEALKMIMEACKDKRGILIEVEDPQKADTEEEKQIRLRRIAFYERCGVKMSKVKTWLFGVDYKIMYVPLAEKDFEKCVQKEIASAYQCSLPPELFAKMFKLTSI